MTISAASFVTEKSHNHQERSHLKSGLLILDILQLPGDPDVVLPEALSHAQKQWSPGPSAAVSPWTPSPQPPHPQPKKQRVLPGEPSDKHNLSHRIVSSSVAPLLPTLSAARWVFWMQM